ncbi:MAG: hypothetical protein M3248_02480 [Actinomycetota bacterium]|nr:hypothetical protein [Actinomycetota bacterium]
MASLAKKNRCAHEIKTAVKGYITEATNSDGLGPGRSKIRSMGRSIRNTRKTKNKRKPATVRNEPTREKGKKNDEDWGPVSSAAKKVAKGAVKGAAKEILK